MGALRSTVVRAGTAAFAVFVLAGCTTTNGFLGFLATTKQVDAKVASSQRETQKEIDNLDSEVQTLKAQVAKFGDQTNQINELVSQTRALKAAASNIDAKLSSLPRETLLQLSDLIQRALGTAGAGAAGGGSGAGMGSGAGGGAGSSAGTGGGK